MPRGKSTRHERTDVSVYLPFSRPAGAFLAVGFERGGPACESPAHRIDAQVTGNWPKLSLLARTASTPSRVAKVPAAKAEHQQGIHLHQDQAPSGG